MTRRIRVGVHSEISTPRSAAARAIGLTRRPAGRSIITMFVSGGTTATPPMPSSMRASVRVQPIYVMVERVERRRRENAGLSHRTAEQLAGRPRLIDYSTRAGERRADRRAKTFRERYHDGVRAVGEFGERDTGRHARVPQPGAVEMHRQTVLGRYALNRAQLSDRGNLSARAIVRVLHAHEARRGRVA